MAAGRIAGIFLDEVRSMPPVPPPLFPDLRSQLTPFLLLLFKRHSFQTSACIKSFAHDTEKRSI